MGRERLKDFGIAALIVAAIALGVSMVALQVTSRSNDPGRALPQRMEGLMQERARLLAELARQPGLQAGQDPLETYLALIRKDGAAPHVPLRRTLSVLANNQVSLLALADAYEPFARTPGYSGSLRGLRAHVLSWNQRWEAVFEIFMAGGNLGSDPAPFPDSFVDALAAEVAGRS